MKKMRNIRFLAGSTTYDEMDSPVGKLTIVTSPKGLHAILWDNDRKAKEYKQLINSLLQSDQDKYIIQTKQQLGEYFQGIRKTFNVPLVISGTDFQVQAWRQLLKIPYAQTISYAEQAKQLGDKKKARAVGMANGVNPISIIIPCHRVIGSNGNLVGFGGGLNKKNYLLQLEKKYL